MNLIEFAMKFGKKISGSNLQKLGNTSFVNKYIENIRKKGFDNARITDPIEV